MATTRFLSVLLLAFIFLNWVYFYACLWLVEALISVTAIPFFPPDSIDIKCLQVIYMNIAILYYSVSSVNSSALKLFKSRISNHEWLDTKMEKNIYIYISQIHMLLISSNIRITVYLHNFLFSFITFPWIYYFQFLVSPSSPEPHIILYPFTHDKLLHSLLLTGVIFGPGLR